MLPVAFHVGPVAVYSYGITLSLAFIAGWAFARWYLARNRIDKAAATDLLLAAIVGGIVGARILYVVTEWRYFAEDPLRVFMLQQGGMTFYGGLAGGAVAVAALVRWKRLPVAVIADGAALIVPIGAAIGRVGCFLNGCCAGRPTSSWLGVTFPGGSGPVLPTQLIDSAANLAIAGILLVVFLRRRPMPGTLWWGYLVLYGVSRSAVEVLRTNAPVALGLTQAQLISIPMVLAGIAGLAVLRHRVRRYEASAAPRGSG